VVDFVANQRQTFDRQAVFTAESSA